MYFCKLYRDDLPFFQQNIDLKDMKLFSELYEMGEEGDKIMACIYRAYDLKSSYYHSIEKESERLKDICENYLDDSEYDMSPYRKHIEYFKDVCRSDIQKKLDVFKQDIEGREVYFRSLSWSDPEQQQEKDVMMMSHDKLVLKYDELSKKVEAEIEELESLGGYRKSWLEQLSLDHKEQYND